MWIIDFADNAISLASVLIISLALFSAIAFTAVNGWSLLRKLARLFQ